MAEIWSNLQKLFFNPEATPKAVKSLAILINSLFIPEIPLSKFIAGRELLRENSAKSVHNPFIIVNFRRVF